MKKDIKCKSDVQSLCFSVKVLSLLLAFGLVQACSHTPETQLQANNAQADFQGISVKVMERAHDGEFFVHSDQPSQQVDANSVLRLSFDTPDTPQRLRVSDEWQLLKKALNEIAHLTEQYHEITKTVASLPADHNHQTDQWQRRIVAFDKKLVALEQFFNTKEMIGLLKVDSTQLALRSVEENKSPNELRAEILMSIRDTLHQEARRFANDVDEYEVIVRAYLVPETGDVQGLSIKGYNNLQSRPLKPLSRLGIIPTDAEAQQLRSAYDGAQAVKTAVVGIKENAGEITTSFSSMAKEAQRRLSSVSQHAQAMAEQWDQLFNENTQQALNQSQQTNVVTLSTKLNSLKQDVQAIKVLKKDIESLKARLQYKDAISLVLELKGNLNAIKHLKNDMATISERIKKWPNHIASISTHASLAVNALLAEQNAALSAQIKTLSSKIEQGFTTFVTAMSAAVPGAQVALDYLSNDRFVSQGEKLLALSKRFDRGEPGAIPRPLDKLEPAEVDLRRAGITPGDMVELDVGFFRKTQYDQPEKRISYTARTVLTDWHRRFSSDLIFVRGEKGFGSEEFKPNVGVTLEWHYGSRTKSPGFLERLDMGVGVHAANLDQDADETIELGAGVNFSFLDGLIRFGYGYNVSAEQHPNYYWFGFELFSMLNKKNKI